MSWGAGLAASLLVVLPRPATWIVALASFLVRGGILLFLAPIVVTPSTVGLANILGPTITTFWLGGMSLGFATVVTAIFAVFFAWLVIGGWVAAVTERDLIALVAADDELGAGGTIPRPSGSRRRGRVWRIVLLRLAAYVPLALALGYGSLRLVQATYRELTLPSDMVTPIAWRVISTAPEAVIAILVTWALGETLGSLGARRIVVWGQSVDQAYFGAWADMLRRPLSTIGTFVLPTVVMALVVAPIVLASGVAWDYLRTQLAAPAGANPALMLLSMLTFVAIWLAGLLAGRPGVALAERGWTVELVRVRETFGDCGMAPRGSGNARRRPAALNAPPDRGRHEVVMVIESRACPSCSDFVPPGRVSCPHCGAVLAAVAEPCRGQHDRECASRRSDRRGQSAGRRLHRASRS